MRIAVLLLAVATLVVGGWIGARATQSRESCHQVGSLGRPGSINYIPAHEVCR